MATTACLSVWLEIRLRSLLATRLISQYGGLEPSLSSRLDGFMLPLVTRTCSQRHSSTTQQRALSRCRVWWNKSTSTEHCTATPNSVQLADALWRTTISQTRAET